MYEWSLTFYSVDEINSKYIILYHLNSKHFTQLPGFKMQCGVFFCKIVNYNNNRFFYITEEH